MQNIFQKLAFFFRRQYISSLKSFSVKTTPSELKKDTYSDLSVELKKKLDVCTEVYTNFKKKIDEEKQEWENVAEETKEQGEDLKARVYKTLAHEPAKQQVRDYEKVIKKINSDTKLYLVGFDKNLTSREAKSELSRIGFTPADVLETVLLLQEYKDGLSRYLPIITLEAYFDADKKIGLKKDDLYSLCLYSGHDGAKFGTIGDIEYAEFSGHAFMENTLFLVKPI